MVAVAEHAHVATHSSLQNGGTYSHLASIDCTVADYFSVPLVQWVLHFSIKCCYSCCVFFQRPEKMVWHGSTSGGQRHLDSYCESWRVSDRAVTGMATPLLSGSLMQQTSSSCSSSYIVLCVENSNVGHAKR